MNQGDNLSVEEVTHLLEMGDFDPHKATCNTHGMYLC